MIQIGVHKRAALSTLSLRVAQYDPTRTITLRNAFVREMNVRFRKLRGAIRQAIVEDDVFGLKTPQPLTLASPGRQAFNFTLTQQKVDGFMEWLRREMDGTILQSRTYTQFGTALSDRWTDQYIQAGYGKGISRGRTELLNVGYNVPGLQPGELQSMLSMPMHVDRIGVLYSRAFNELKGVTDWMDSSISKVLAEGLMAGDSPALLARKMNRIISGQGNDLGIKDSLGRYIPAERRARTIARTEIIRAHHAGTVQEYKNWAANNVIVQAEWYTAQDDRVCMQCSQLQGTIYSVDQIWLLIPAHPNCRCIALPVNPKIVQDADTLMQRTTNEAWKKDPVGSRMKSQALGRQYMKHKEKFKKTFENLSEEDATMFRDLKRSNTYEVRYGAPPEEQLRGWFRNNFENNPNLVRDMLRGWTTSTQKDAPQAFKYAARLTEKGLQKMVFKEGEVGANNMLRWIESEGGIKAVQASYLEMRAFSQAYLEWQYAGQTAFELYRGVGGRTGAKIVNDVYKALSANVKRTKWPMTDMPVVGYSNHLNKAIQFGETFGERAGYTWKQGELVFRSNVQFADIMVPRDLFTPFFNQSFLNEMEWIIKGEQKLWNFEDMMIRIFLENGRSFSKLFDTLEF